MICFERQSWCSVTSAFQQFYKKPTQHSPTPQFLIHSLKYRHKGLHSNKKCSYLYFPVRSSDLADIEKWVVPRKRGETWTLILETVHCSSIWVTHDYRSAKSKVQSCISYRWITLNMSVHSTSVKCTTVVGWQTEMSVLCWFCTSHLNLPLSVDVWWACCVEMIQGLMFQLKLNLLYIWKSYYSSNSQSHPSLLKNYYRIYFYKVGGHTQL